MSRSIEHRMGATKLRILDQAGRPLADTKVSYELINHKFLFGCGGFDTLSYVSEIPKGLLEKINVSEEEYRAHFKDRVDKWLGIFNYATIPFYWGGYEPTEGQIEYDSRMKTAEYLTERGVTVKGHPLCWHTVCAPWLMEYDNKTIMEKQLARINREVTAFAGKVDKWDVINETVIMPVFDKYDNAVTRICNEYGRIPLIKEVFAAARSANPKAQLLINDFNLSDDYRRVISDCLDAGVTIDAIGIQTHQHQGYKGMDWLNDVLERFSVFGLPLHFTENTLVSGHLMPPEIVDLNDYVVDEWPSTPEGEERQAKEWAEMYERLFEEPLVEAVTGWDFADGGWLKAPSGIIAEDNRCKSAYYKLREYVKKTWHSEGSATTDAEGYVTITGYKGKYAVQNGTAHGDFTIDTDKEQTVTIYA